MSITAQQVYATPGRPGGPYTVPNPPVPLPVFRLVAARQLNWQLAATRSLTFVLPAEKAPVFALEV